jgi:hypothetical protein
VTPIKKSGTQPTSDTPPGASRAAEQLNESAMNSLPLLTEVVAESDANLPSVLSEQEIQQLLRHLEARIETLFTQKLGMHLEQLQRQAIDQALDEIKAELPELLHDAMNTYLDSR